MNKQLIQEIVSMTANYVPRMCWSNAVEALLTSEHEALAGAMYVEGWAIPDSTLIAVEHGWLELTDGTVLDLTWLDCEAKYYAGVAYAASELSNIDPDFLPLIWITGGWGGMKNEAYKRAYIEALADMGGTSFTEAARMIGA